MPPRKKQAAMPALTASNQTSQFEIGSLYEQELQSLNEHLRQQAALAMFKKLQPNNRITVDQFLTGMKANKDVWSVVSNMGIVDFADAINDGKRLREQRARHNGEPLSDGKRTRLNDSQKQALKNMVLEVLGHQKEGLNRAGIAASISYEEVMDIGVDRKELPNKLRQPLGELVADGKIYTVGEKRLMKYLHGQGPKKKA